MLIVSRWWWRQAAFICVVAFIASRGGPSVYHALMLWSPRRGDGLQNRYFDLLGGEERRRCHSCVAGRFLGPAAGETVP